MTLWCNGFVSEEPKIQITPAPDSKFGSTDEAKASNAVAEFCYYLGEAYTVGTISETLKESPPPGFSSDNIVTRTRTRCCSIAHAVPTCHRARSVHVSSRMQLTSPQVDIALGQLHQA